MEPKSNLMKKNQRLIIYQAFPRIFTNTNSTDKPWGTLQENGSGKLNEISDTLLKSLSDMGVNCLWLTGVIENATKTAYPEHDIPADNPNVVKGEAGSPYAIKDYYDVAPCVAEDIDNRMKEFKEVVKRTHKQGMKLIIDFIPNHTARVYHSDSAPTGIEDFGTNDDISMFFNPENNYYYIVNQQFSPDFDLGAEGNAPYVEFPAKATGNDCFTAFCTRNDWYETVKLNYGVDPWNGSHHFDPIPNTWLKMLHILRFWASKGIDGFRCDMVFMVPQDFWHWAIPQVKRDYPDIIFIGEIYDVSLYHQFLDYCHFDYLYDKVNLYDTLVGIERYNVSAAQLTSCWKTVDGIGNRMLNFLENHDEVRFASREFANDPMKIVPFLTVSAMMSKGPFMIYYGQELGEMAHDNEGFAGDNNRSTIFDYWSYDTLRRWYNLGECNEEKLTKHEKWLRDVYSKILRLCNSSAPLREGDFFDLMYMNLRNPDFNPHKQFAFIRYTDKEAILVVANFDGKPVDIQLNIPDLAIDMANLYTGEQTTRDILWNLPVSFSVSANKCTPLRINGYDSMILPLRKRFERTEEKASAKKESK